MANLCDIMHGVLRHEKRAESAAKFTENFEV